ncbi:DUF6417 family protein [Streptomyces olivaceus]
MSADIARLIPPQDAAVRCLEVLTLDEVHDLFRMLQLIAAEGLDKLSDEAEWLAREIAARIPSETDWAWARMPAARSKGGGRRPPPECLRCHPIPSRRISPNRKPCAGGGRMRPDARRPVAG